MLIISLCVALALAVAGCGGSSDDSSSTQATSEATTTESSGGDTNLNAKPKVTVPDGAPPKKLEEKEIVEGDGAEAKSGDEVTVQYVGVGYDSKEEFDSSWSRGEPSTFSLEGSDSRLEPGHRRHEGRRPPRADDPARTSPMARPARRR